jgi:hypothetical protein
MIDDQYTDEIQKSNDRYSQENKKLLRIRSELYQGVKKQYKLLELLKKQKMHLELIGSLNFK